MKVHDPSATSLRRAAGRWVARLLALGFSVTVLAAVVVIVVLPRATNGSAMTVLSGSMTPGIPVGSVVLVRPVDPSTLEPGDISTYAKAGEENTFITHRVVEVIDRGDKTAFIFQGDANRDPDPRPIPAADIRGEVWLHVPHLGALRDAIHGTSGLALVAMLLLGGYATSQIRSGLRERRPTSDQTADARCRPDPAKEHLDARA